MVKNADTPVTAPVWTYKDWTITLNVRGDFVATGPENTKLHASSLAAIKRGIDATIASKFEPFDAISDRFGKLQTFRIVGIQKSQYRGRGSVFVDDARVLHYHGVTRDTPENRRLVQAWKNIREANQAKIDKLNVEIEKALRAIPVETPKGPAK